MWPFTKKEREPDVRVQQLVEVQDEFPKGSRVNYLGVSMVISGHGDLLPGYPSLIFVPSVNAEYVDKQGVIRSVKFHLRDLPALRAEMARDE
jgi:hypothetical protein